MSYLTQMLGADRAELRLGGGRHGGARRADPRLRAQARRTTSATSGSTSRAARSTSCCRSRSCWRSSSSRRASCRRSTPYADGARSLEADEGRRRQAPVTEQSHRRSGPPRRRSRSSSSARTAAASSTSTRRIPFENPTPLSNFLELLSILLIPAALCYTFGAMVGDTRQGWARARGDDRHLRRRCSSLCVCGRAARQPALAALGVDQVASDAPARRQHGRQGGPLRHRQLGALGDRDDRRLERLRQRDARLVHAARRPRAAVADPARRGRSSAASAPASTAC